MPDMLDEALKRLADPDNGWVYRRDAADLLGRSAFRAISALAMHEDDADPDVRAAVHSALGKARTGLEHVEQGAAQPYSLKALAEYCHRPGKRDVQPDGDRYVIEVRLDDGRSQRVYLEALAQDEKHPLVRARSYCSKSPGAKLYRWAIRNNTRLHHCAFAVTEEDGEERLALVRCFRQDVVDPAQVKMAIKEITRYADWIENKLTGVDLY
ncbi:MAG: hypothetical protein ACLFTT_07625 [Candidatus Hydrogenedentota bacterium]